MGRRRKGRTVRKNTSAAAATEEDVVYSSAPHSFVIHRGKSVGKCVQDLTRDFRQVMEPYTASDIKVRKKNVIKDFVHVAGLLKVSHLVMFTKTDKGPYLKIGRFPRGPTLTFKVQNYTLSRDVRSSLKRQITYEKQFANHALLIMNNFSGKNVKEEEEGENKEEGKISMGSREIELMSSMFQNMFPSINVTKIKLNSIRRCVLLNYNADNGTVDFRHYTIKVVPVGMTRGVKKIVAQSKIPNLSRYDNMAEYLETGGGNASESEAEGDESSHVTLPQNVSSRGNSINSASSIKLVELGPRLTLEPIKIEEGLLDGDILYHKLVAKTEEEKAAIKAARLKRNKEKEARKKIQAQNVKRKEMEKNKHKEKSLEGMKFKKRNDLPEGFKSAPDSDGDSDDNDGGDADDDDDDDDAEWYRKEVGQKPDKDLFDGSKESNSGRKRSGSGLPARFNKKFKAKDGSAKSRGGIMKGGKRDFSNDRGKRNNNDRGDKKKKRPKDVFNNQGLGPNFNKNKPNKGPRVTATKKKYRKKS